MSRALVLGAGGFIGSHVARRLVADGWEVRAVVHDPDAPHVQSRLGVALDSLRLVRGDAFDADLLDGAVAGVDAVFPFAAHSGAARSMQEPLADVAANAVGQLVLLESLRRVNPGARVVFPGSRLQYGRVHVLPVSEAHPQQPTSLYGLHKQTGESYHRLYHQLYGIRTCMLRISNPYGPHQDRPDRAYGVVGTFLATAARGQTITLYGGGHQRREYVYIDDLVDACMLAVTDERAVGKAYNVGGPWPVTLRQMAETVVRVVGAGDTADTPWPSLEQAVETGDYVGDISRIGTELGWRPVTGLEDGLSRTWLALSAMLAGTT